MIVEKCHIDSSFLFFFSWLLEQTEPTNNKSIETNQDNEGSKEKKMLLKWLFYIVVIKFNQVLKSVKIMYF